MDNQQVSGVSPAFANPPAQASAFRQSYENSPAAAGQPGAIPPVAQPVAPEPQPVSEPNVPPIIIPNARNTIPILPDSRQLTPPANPQSQTVASPNNNPPEDTTPAPSPAGSGGGDAYLQKQLEAERQMFAQERAQWQQAYAAQQQQLQQAAAAQQELAQYRQQAAIAQQLSDDKMFEGLETIDANDARRLLSIMTSTMMTPLSTVKQELDRQQQQLTQQQQYVQDQVYRMSQQRASQKLQEAHPDFAELANNPEFLQYARQRDSHMSKTREQIAWEEFTAGNPDYVINLVNQFKGIKPTTETIQTPPPVQTAGAVTPPQPASSAVPQFTLAQLNTLMQMRSITPEQYRDGLNQLRRAQQQQPA